MADNRRRAPLQPKPTSSESAERAVIGCCLHDDKVFWEGFNKLKTEFFTIPRLGRIWGAMVRCSEIGKPINQSWIAILIDPIDAREDTPLKIFMAALFNDSPPVSEADLYISTVANFSYKRAALDSLEKSRSEILATDIGTPPENLKDIVIKNVASAFNGESDDDMMDYHDWGVKVFHNSANALKKEERGGIGLSPGLAGVEKVIGRLLGGKLIVVAGMSSSGKSALARQIMESASLSAMEQGLGYGYIGSLEMTGQEYATRHLSEILNIPSYKIESGDLRSEEVERIGDAVARMKKYPLIVDSRPRQTMEQLRARAIKVKNTKGLSIMALDHLLLIKESSKLESLMDRVSNATIESKNLAKELGIPVLLLAQIDEKKLMESTTKWPNSTHLFGGQAIMQNADIVLFVHRPEVLMAKNEPSMNSRAKEGEKTPWQKWNDTIEPYRGKAYVYNNKRRGGAGNVREEMIFRAPIMTFEDISSTPLYDSNEKIF